MQFRRDSGFKRLTCCGDTINPMKLRSRTEVFLGLSLSEPGRSLEPESPRIPAYEVVGRDILRRCFIPRNKTVSLGADITSFSL